MKLRGEWPAVGIGVLGVVVLIVVVFLLRGRMVEQWHLWKLDSGEPEIRELAARKLGELQSIRAIPRLTALLRGKGRKDPYMTALARIGLPALPVARDAMRDVDQRVRMRGLTIMLLTLGSGSMSPETIQTMVPKLIA